MKRSFSRIEKREMFDPQWICEELIDEDRGCIKEEYQGQKGYLRFVKERFLNMRSYKGLLREKIL